MARRPSSGSTLWRPLLLSPWQAAVPDGALLVDPTHARLRASEMEQNARFQGDFDIVSGITGTIGRFLNLPLRNPSKC